MAISNVAAVAQSGGAPGDPKYTNLVTLDLDDSYTTGGYADFTASVQSIIGGINGYSAAGYRKINLCFETLGTAG